MTLLPAPGSDTAADGLSENLVDLLPHRPPMRLLDFAAMRADGVVVARQHIPVDGPILAAHLPGLPIWPGALLLEAMAQTTAVWLLSRRGGLRADELPLFGAADCRFLQPVRPGATIDFTTRRLSVHDHLGLFAVVAADQYARDVARARISVTIASRAVLDAAGC